MSGPTLNDLVTAFTQARDNAEGYATGTHAGCAAVVRELLKDLPSEVFDATPANIPLIDPMQLPSK